ncbi:MAG: M23 family metallopeptidase [Pyrinomonadaceae bacterium]
MSKEGFRIGRVVWLIYLIGIHIVAAAFLIDKLILPNFHISDNITAKVEDPTASTPIPTPLPVPSEFYDDPTANANSAPTPTAATTSQPGSIIIPVAGIKPEQLTDTFTAARSGGRVHDAIDIMAPGGAPVIAAVDGKIIKFHDSVPGGISIYELGADGKYVYYYAHLQKRADGLKEGDSVRQGATIGFVGDTGNAGPGNYHLHFAITIAGDPKRWWEGQNINPFPLLRGVAQ